MLYFCHVGRGAGLVCRAGFHGFHILPRRINILSCTRTSKAIYCLQNNTVPISRKRQLHETVNSHNSSKKIYKSYPRSLSFQLKLQKLVFLLGILAASLLDQGYTTQCYLGYIACITDTTSSLDNA